VTRVVVADDQPVVLEGFAAMLGAAPDLEVVGTAPDGERLVALVGRTQPDVAVVDVRMPVLDGIAATREIRATTASRVLVLTTFELDEYIFAALRAGASGFVVKDNEPDDLIRAVRAVASGASMLAPSVTNRVVTEYATRAKELPPATALQRLTGREREVMALAAQGLSNEQIALRLYLSVATVKTHISRLMLKLDARDRSQVVVTAYETGLVRPGWMA
jgi:DNA-binding NarL/FixJ family response regulator